MKGAAAIVVALVVAQPTAAAGTLRIEGDAAARFVLDCAGFAADGAPPYERDFDGALECTLTQTAPGGRLDVTVRSDAGNVTRLSTAGRGSTVRLNIQ